MLQEIARDGLWIGKIDHLWIFDRSIDNADHKAAILFREGARTQWMCPSQLLLMHSLGSLLNHTWRWPAMARGSELPGIASSATSNQMPVRTLG